MEGSAYCRKHRESKLMAQVKWLQDDDYDFLDYDYCGEEYAEDIPENYVASSSVVGTDEESGGYKRRKVKKVKPKKEVDFIEDKSNVLYSNVSEVENAVSAPPAIKEKKKPIISSSKNKFVEIDTGRFALFLQKWSAFLPIIKHFNDSVPTTNYDSMPKLIHYQEDGDAVIDVRFKLKILFNNLICRLCKGILYNAYTIKGCLHTFCKSCIIIYLILIRKQCPICHLHINTNLEESIEYDNCIQSIVDKLFPQYKIESSDDIKDDLNGNVSIKSQDISLKEEMLSKYTSYLWEVNDEGIEMDKGIYSRKMHIQGKNESISNLKAYLTLRPVDGSKGPCCYIAVEKEMFISDLGNYLLLKLEKYGICNVVFYLNNVPLPLNHTIEFVCKSRRMLMVEPIPLRYELKYK